MAERRRAELIYSNSVGLFRALFRTHNTLGRYFVFEGSPGAGKTSILGQLAAYRGTLCLPELDHCHTPVRTFKQTRSRVQAWYLEQELRRQSIISRWLKEDGIVAQDRSVYSTIGFAYAATDQHCWKGCLNWAAGIEVRSFIAPDLLIVLTVKPRTSIKRRQAFRHDRRFSPWFDDRFLGRFNEFYRVVLPRITDTPILTIETDDISIKETTCSLMPIFTTFLDARR